jgi:hypothetical protein
MISEDIDFVSVGQAAEQLTQLAGELVKPSQISLLLYHKELQEKYCPRIGHAHVIARSYLPEILRIMRRKGWINWEPVAHEAQDAPQDTAAGNGLTEEGSSQ